MGRCYEWVFVFFVLSLILLLLLIFFFFLGEAAVVLDGDELGSAQFQDLFLHANDETKLAGDLRLEPVDVILVILIIAVEEAVACCGAVVPFLLFVVLLFLCPTSFGFVSCVATREDLADNFADI